MHEGFLVPMVRHDQGRWRCPRCGHIHSVRPPSGTESLPARVVQGDVISDMSAPKRQRLLEWLARQAQREFGIRPPGEGKQWWVVPMPGSAGTGLVALGVGRSPARGNDNWRVLAFTHEFAPGGLADMTRKLGEKSHTYQPPLDASGAVGGAEWLERVLNPSTSKDEALQRLWIILGRTNAFTFRQ